MWYIPKFTPCFLVYTTFTFEMWYILEFRMGKSLVSAEVRLYRKSRWSSMSLTCPTSMTMCRRFTILSKFGI